MGGNGDTYRVGVKRIVRPAVAKISAMIGSEEGAAESEFYQCGGDDGGSRTIEINTVIERVGTWEMEGVV